MWWKVLLIILVGHFVGKKIKKWANDPEVRREWNELVEAISQAYADERITIEEILQIVKEAKDVLHKLSK